jgi:hypothetical protein
MLSLGCGAWTGDSRMRRREAAGSELKITSILESMVRCTALYQYRNVFIFDVKQARGRVTKSHLLINILILEATRCR